MSGLWFALAALVGVPLFWVLLIIGIAQEIGRIDRPKR